MHERSFCGDSRTVRHSGAVCMVPLCILQKSDMYIVRHEFDTLPDSVLGGVCLLELLATASGGGTNGARAMPIGLG